MQNKDLCPICGVGNLSRESEMDEVVYKGVKKHVTTAYCVCDHCHIEQAGTSELRANKRIMNEFKKEVDHLLTGREILAIRVSLGITQDQASLIFGGGPNAFTKYENDDVVQSEAMDKLIRGAQKYRPFFEYLCNEAGVTVSKPRRSLHEANFSWSGPEDAISGYAQILEVSH